MLRRSRFAHCYRRGDEVCIFHALTGDVLFGGAKLLELFHAFPAADGRMPATGTFWPSRARALRRQSARAVTENRTKSRRAERFRGMADRRTAAVEAFRAKGLLLENGQRDRRLLREFRAEGENLHRGRLSLMYLIPEARCNLRCTYCFIDKETAANAAAMTEATAVQAVRYLFRHSQRARHRKIIFYGGEPLLAAPAVLAAADEAIRLIGERDRRRGLDLSLLTNGLLMTPALARALALRKVKVSVSIDGPPEVHDRHRKTLDGGPSFDRAVAAIGMLRDAGLDPSISCTVTQTSLDRWEDVLRLVTDELHLKGLGFNILLPGPCSDTSVKYASPRGPTEAILMAFERFRALGIYEDRVMRRVKPFVRRKFHFKDCLGVGGQIAVAPDGAVGPCQGFLGRPEYFPLDVFRDFEQSPLDHPLFAEWTRRFPLNFDECLECPAISICGGGCPLAALREEGSIWQIDRRICEQVKPIHEWLLWDLREGRRGERAPHEEDSR